MGTEQVASTNPTPLTYRLRQGGVAIVVLVVGVWLFGDTYRRHFGHRRSPDIIRFAHFGTYQDYLFFQGVVSEFNDDSGDIRVAQEYVAGLSGHYRTKLRQQALVQDLPDVALVQLAFFREHGELFEDLSAVTAETDPDSGGPIALDAVGLRAFEINGVQRGLPISGGPLVIYLNKRCFRRVAASIGREVPLPTPDWTIAEFQRTAEAMTRDFNGDGTLDQFGFYLPRWVYYLPFIWSSGATLANSDGTRWLFRGEEAARAMTLYQQLALTRRATPRDHEVAQLFQDTAFLTGKIAMCVNGPWFRPFLMQTTLRDDYLVLPIPRGPAGSITRVTWDGIVVARDLAPARRKLATRFVRYLLSGDVQERIARTGKALPARRGAIPDGVASSEETNVFKTAIDSARLEPAWRNFRAIDRTINARLQGLTRVEDAMSPQTMIDALASDPVIVESFQGAGVHDR